MYEGGSIEYILSSSINPFPTPLLRRGTGKAHTSSSHQARYHLSASSGAEEQSPCCAAETCPPHLTSPIIPLLWSSPHGMPNSGRV